MSIQSYKRRTKVERVAGPGTGTCLPAALDCLLSGNRELPVDAYTKYGRAYWTQVWGGPSNRLYRNTLIDLMLEAGGGSLKRLKHVYVPNEEACVNTLHKWVKSQKIFICIEETHVVGLRPVSGGFRMVGSWIPKGVSHHDVLSPSEIFSYLAHPPRRKGEKRYNMMALSL